MYDNCQKYKASRSSMRTTEPSFLRSLFGKLTQGASFRFITFEEDDYNKQQLTFLFFQEQPDKIQLQVGHAADIDPAIREVIRLNTRIEWDLVQIIIPAIQCKSRCLITVELLFKGLDMQIDNTGRLVLN